MLGDIVKEAHGHGASYDSIALYVRLSVCLSVCLSRDPAYSPRDRLYLCSLLQLMNEIVLSPLDLCRHDLDLDL